MSLFAARQNRQLLFRFYLIIVAGLIVVATILDFGFSRLQDTVASIPNQWVEGHFRQIESELSKKSSSEWLQLTVELEARLGFPVRILSTDQVAHIGAPSSNTVEIFDDQGRPSFFRMSPTLDAGIQIGPLREVDSPASNLMQFIPPLFYLSIFILVGLWLRPLIRDLNLITDSTRNFAEDYRQPLKTLEKTSSLSDLAQNFDEMSLRIGGLIQGQKELTSALSHEMRTPLARIRFALAVIGDSKKDDIAKELESISQDVQEIDQLIGTMLDYARLDHPDFEMRWQLTPLADWLEQIVSKFRVHSAELRIENDLPANTVRLDPHLMELALSNLLANACRYAKNLIVVKFSYVGSHYRLSVEDDGQGIPAEDREAVFKAFSRLDNSRNRETGGYGLGLAIVARIATLHGGSVLAEESELGGARIALSWPEEPNNAN